MVAAIATAALLALSSLGFANPTDAVLAQPQPPEQGQEQPRERGGHQPHDREHAPFHRFLVRPGPTAGSPAVPSLGGGSLYAPGVDPARLRAERALSPQQLASLGQDAYDHGDFGVASQAARLALADDPRNPAAQAVLSLSQGRGTAAEFASARDAVASPASVAVKAAPAFAATPTAAPTTTPARQQGQALTAQAAQALSIGDYTSAVGAANAALAQDPANARAWNVRAVAQTRLGRYQDAVDDATRALSLDAAQPAALVTRSLAEGKLGRFDAAEKDARAALALGRSESDSRALEALAFALAGRGRRDDAVEQLRRAAAADASLQPLYAKASELARAQDIAALFGDAGQAAPAAPARPLRWLKVAIPTATLGLWMIVLGLLPRRPEATVTKA